MFLLFREWSQLRRTSRPTSGAASKTLATGWPRRRSSGEHNTPIYEHASSRPNPCVSSRDRARNTRAFAAVVHTAQRRARRTLPPSHVRRHDLINDEMESQAQRERDEATALLERRRREEEVRGALPVLRPAAHGQAAAQPPQWALRHMAVLLPTGSSQSARGGGRAPAGRQGGVREACRDRRAGGARARGAASGARACDVGAGGRRAPQLRPCDDDREAHHHTSGRHAPTRHQHDPLWQPLSSRPACGHAPQSLPAAPPRVQVRIPRTVLITGASSPAGRALRSHWGPSRAKSAFCSLRRALLMPQVNAGSLYRGGKRA